MANSHYNLWPSTLLRLKLYRPLNTAFFASVVVGGQGLAALIWFCSIIEIFHLVSMPVRLKRRSRFQYCQQDHQPHHEHKKDEPDTRCIPPEGVAHQGC